MSGDNGAYALEVKFGSGVMAYGFTAIPNVLLDTYPYLGMTPGELVFTAHIWQYWWTKKQPYPSLITIAKAMNISRRQAGRYAESLQEKQLLTVTERYDPEYGQLSGEYDFSKMIRAAEKLAKQLEKPDGKHQPAKRRTKMTTSPSSNLTNPLDVSRGAMSNSSTKEDELQEDEKRGSEEVTSSPDPAIWSRVLASLEAECNRHAFKGTFATSQLVSLEAGEAVVSAEPSAYQNLTKQSGRLEDRLAKQLNRTIRVRIVPRE